MLGRKDIIRSITDSTPVLGKEGRGNYELLYNFNVKEKKIKQNKQIQRNNNNKKTKTNRRKKSKKCAK